MKTLPSIIVVADRGHFLAYESMENRSLRPVTLADLPQGKLRPREQFSDRAGGFPNSGTMGKGNSATEKMTQAAEREMQTFREIVKLIDNVLEAQHPASWAFAAPAEINAAILDGLSPRWKNRLIINLPKDLTGMPAHEIRSHFTYA